MTTDALLAELDRYVAEACGIVQAARAMVENDALDRASDLTERRDRLMALLQRFQVFKHRDIFNPSIGGGRSPRSAAAQAMKTECILMGDAFGRYHSRWGHQDVTAEWSLYRDEMLAMTETLLAHLHREQRAITRFLCEDAAIAA